jgi:hypothetical protein
VEAKIYYASSTAAIPASTASSMTFTTDMKIDDTGTGTGTTPHCYQQSIAIDSADNVFVVYHSTFSGTDLYIVKSDDGGATWDASVVVSAATSGQFRGRIGVGTGDVLYVCWDDTRSNFVIPVDTRDIYFAKSIDGGATWTLSGLVDDGSGIQWQPAIVVDGTTIHVVWIDERTSPTDIRHSTLED